jgi:hypothetical protein
MKMRLGRAGLLGSGALATLVGIATFVQASTPANEPADGSTSVVTAIDAPVHGSRPSISDDGRWLTYQGLPLDGSERSSTVFLVDLDDPAASPIELTAPVPESRLGDSVHPIISGDGCSVAVITQLSYDLFRDDDRDARWDVYRQTLPHCGGTLGDWDLVSTQSSADGDTSALDRVDPTDAPAVNRSGAVIAFTHLRFANRDDLFTVSVVDLTVPLGDDGRITVVEGTPVLPPDTVFRYVGQRHPDVSDDGQFVVFTSDAVADSVRPEWGVGPIEGDFATSQVYVWDRAATTLGETVLLVSGVDGLPAAEGASSPVISGSGQYVAYLTSSPDVLADAILPECRGVCPLQVVRTNLVDGSTTLVSKANSGGGTTQLAADLGAAQPAITDDGSQVAFVSRSTNLFVSATEAGTILDDGDVVISTVDLGEIERISVLSDGVTPAPAVHAHPALSANGHVVAFDTLAADIEGRRAVPGLDGGRQVVTQLRPAQLSAPVLDVGTVAVGLPGPEWYIPIRNDGRSSFVPTSVVSSRIEFAITGGTCQLPLPVLPGQWCTVELVLTPTLEGPIEAELTVSDGIPGGGSVTTVLRGAGGEPALVPPQRSLDYPLTVVGQRSPAIAFDIGNIGFGPATITSIEMTGTHPGDFVIESDSCIGYSINPGSTCSIALSFAPTQAGHRTASVLVSTSLGQYTTVLANGDATRVSSLVAASEEVRPGDGVGLGGSGWAPGAEVLVSWADGRGETVAVRASSEGTFLTALPTSRNERSGVREIVAQSGDTVTRVEVRVLRVPSESIRPPG